VRSRPRTAALMLEPHTPWRAQALLAPASSAVAAARANTRAR
jgi:hypothetical protein